MFYIYKDKIRRKTWVSRQSAITFRTAGGTLPDLRLPLPRRKGGEDALLAEAVGVATGRKREVRWPRTDQRNAVAVSGKTVDVSAGRKQAAARVRADQRKRGARLGRSLPGAGA